MSDFSNRKFGLLWRGRLYVRVLGLYRILWFYRFLFFDFMILYYKKGELLKLKNVLNIG